ncbi:MAG: FkbM family methyltransferase [Sulfuriferula sp.]
MTIHDPSMGDILNHQMRSPAINALSCPHNPQVKENASPCEPQSQPEKITTHDLSHEQTSTSPLFDPTSQIHIRLPRLLSLDGEKFINAAYLEILDRTPDPTGLHYFNQRLNDGISRIQILGQLAASGETEIAKKWYKKLRWTYLLLKYRRVPVLGWLIELICAISRVHLNELLVYDDVQFINHAFQSVLGRLPDQQNFEHYLTQLRNGRSKLSILSEIKTSNRDRVISNRVAGLTAASWLHKLRNMPFIKWAIDTLTLPSAVADSRQRLQGIELSIQRINSQQQSDVATIRAELKDGQTATLTLAQQVDKLSKETTTLIDQEHAALSYRISKVANDAQTALTKTQMNLARLVQEATSQLSASLPQTAEDIKATILASLLKAETAQKRLHQQLDKLAYETASLIGQEHTTLLHEINNFSHSVQTALIKTQADLTRQAQEAAEQLNTSLPQSIDEIKTTILARLILGDQAQEQLRLQLSQHAVNTAALISKESSTVSNDVHKLTNEMLATLSNIQADMTNRVQQVAEYLNVSLPQTLKEDNTTILAQLAESITAQEQLRLQLGQHAVNTAALISKESSTVSNDVHKHTSEMLATLSNIQADMTYRVQQVAEYLNVSLPQTLKEDNTTILAQLAESITAQEQLHLQLDQLNPQLGRIELYGLTAARRVAVPFGTDALMVRTSVGYVLCASEDHALIAALIESGELEPGTRHLIQHILSPGDIFIDVGANVGMHTLAAAKSMRGQGRVIAFEPYPPTARLLEKTIWMNGFKNMVEIHCIAASDEQRERTLYLGATSGHHSLFPLDEASRIDIEPVTVRTTTIDQIMANAPFAHLIKIDAEGAELEVLAGAESLIKQNKDIAIIAEFGNSHLKRTNITSQDWLERFSQLGLEYQAIHPDSGALRNISIDELDAIESINLFFARRQSPVWTKAGGSQ